MAAIFENRVTLFYGTLGFHRVKDTLLTRTTNIFMVMGTREWVAGLQNGGGGTAFQSSVVGKKWGTAIV